MTRAKAHEVVPIVAWPLFKVVVENGTGASFTGTVRVSVAGSAPQPTGGIAGPTAPGTILAGGVFEKRLLPAGEYEVRVERWLSPGKHEFVFSQRVLLGDETEVRIVFR